MNKNNLISKCKSILSDEFILDIPMTILSLKELEEAIEHSPKWWDESCDREIIHQAIFLIPPMTVEEVYKAVGEAKSEYEQVDYYENVIFWSAPRDTLSKTRWYTIASSSVNNKVTIRNASTTKKLLLLLNE